MNYPAFAQTDDTRFVRTKVAQRNVSRLVPVRVKFSSADPEAATKRRKRPRLCKADHCFAQRPNQERCSIVSFPDQKGIYLQT